MGEIDAGEEVRREPVGEFGQDVGGKGRDEKKVGRVGHFDVPRRGPCPSAQRSEATGRRESTCRVIGVMNWAAPRVMTTWTSAPSLMSWDVRSAAL